MPTLVHREAEFDAGHRVPNHSSKCRNPHGHRYKVVATVTGQLVDRSGASDEGMVVDFGVLSELLKNYVHDTYDHGFIVYKKDYQLLDAFAVWDSEPSKNDFDWKVIVVDWIPTAENMARAIFETLYPEVLEIHNVAEEGPRVSLFSIEVYETPKSSAIYIGGGA